LLGERSEIFIEVTELNGMRYGIKLNNQAGLLRCSAALLYALRREPGSAACATTPFPHRINVVRTCAPWSEPFTSTALERR